MAEFTPLLTSYYDQILIDGVGEIPSGADRIVFLGQLLDSQQEHLKKEGNTSTENTKQILELN